MYNTYTTVLASHIANRTYTVYGGGGLIQYIVYIDANATAPLYYRIFTTVRPLKMKFFEIKPLRKRY